MAHSLCPSGSSPDRIRVLIIEDSPEDARSIEQQLHASSDVHFEVAHVERLDDAQRLITSRYFDVAMLDLSLPDSLGLETALALKKADPDLAVVVMTGLPNLPLQRAALDAGIQEFVVKGDSFCPTLEATLRHAIQRQSLVVEHQHTETALKRSEEGLRALLDSCPIAVFVQQDGLIAYMNAAASEIVGNGHERCLGKLFLSVFDPRDRAAMSDLLDRVIAHNSPAESTDLRLHVHGHGHGHVHVHVHVPVEQIVDAIAVPIHFEGRPAILTVARDVTNRRNADAKSILADRVVASSILAAGMAHEINNPLSYVVADTEIVINETTEIVGELRAAASGSVPLTPDTALRLADQLDELVNLLGDCRGGAERIRCIMEDLKILSDREGGPDEIIDVVSVFRSAVSLLSHEITANGTLVEDYRSAPYVRANPGRLGQVFVNLLTNAIHALLNISVEGQISVSTWACDNGGVAIEVRDNGCGMSLETLNHAFDPFFTTKCPAGGRGLGLSTCHKIITDYGGEITVESAPGKGSSFCIVLPSD